MLLNTQCLLNTVVINRTFFSFCIVYLLFFKSETSLSYSTFDRQEFVKTPKF